MTQSNRTTLLQALGAFAAALLLIAPSALAATPAPGYGQFAGCPSPEENSTIEACVNSEVTGGNFKMGNKNVPITNPFTLSGGGTPTGEFVYNSKGGLSPAKQKVPGGIIGLTGLTWLVEFFGSEGLTLYAQTELAGKPNPLFDPAVLPIKVHLIHPVLGSKCYVGSNTNPIVLNLTTGTTSPPPPNQPITGKEPTPFFDGATGIFHLNDGVYVDNSFAAPGANGCTLTLFGFLPISINGLVNTQSGLPSPAGTNETKQNFNIELTGQDTVYP